VNTSSGLIKGIVLLLIALVLLSVLGLDVTRLFESSAAQGFLQTVSGGARYVWERFLTAPLQAAWDALLRQMLELLKGRLEGRTQTFLIPVTLTNKLFT
jgi:hypothetical protein